ncbi:uncharacterized protein LOC132279948 isoform X2 [Cornus florida]|uniref:uncharacterized protein LOC132279948 isoform X2 n=1 Tax=Cornus florida TaxID=4283 RepID=UPI00289A2487|nr:uncharacterized protein LOC132279948 isoform X2 [Cornus florida]
MSDGTAVGGGGLMRQRHSQGHSSSDEEDLEDDACSRPPSQPLPCPRPNTWVEVVENVLWIASAVFIIYFGDGHSNFIYLLCHDNRIRRIPLYLGVLVLCLNVLFFLYTTLLAWGVQMWSEKWENFTTSALPLLALLGLISFCFFCFALWPIWSFLTLPLVFTLFMASMVILPYLMLGKVRPESE